MPRLPGRWAAALALAVWAPAAAAAAAVPAVEVPVQVLAADGSPVRGLAAADFAVYEGRQRQAVTGFEAVDLTGRRDRQNPPNPPDTADVPAAARRYFVLFFDLSFSQPAALLRAREAAAGLLGALQPSDLVAVATHSQARGADLVLGFTPDREQARAALATLGLVPDPAVRVDPLKLVVARPLAPGAARPAGPDLLRQLERIAGSFDLGDRQSQTEAVDALADSLVEIARLSRSVAGRKEVLFFSQGFDAGPLPAAEKPGAEKRVAGSELAYDLTRMLDELRHSDCRLFPVDLAGAAANGAPNRETLQYLARETGGELSESAGALAATVGRLLDRTVLTYILTVQPAELAADRVFHPLRVTVRGGKESRGAKVVHRPGYWPPRHYAERGRLDRAVLTAAQLLTGAAPGPVGAMVLAAPVPAPIPALVSTPVSPEGRAGADARLEVPLLIAIDGPGLLAGETGADLLAEIYAYALDDRGTVLDFLAQTITLDLAKVGEPLRREGLRFVGRLDLPPGRCAVRVLVRNGRTGEFGMRVARVDVPALAAGGPVLLPALFPERPRGLIARAAGEEGAPLPFAHGGVAYLPAPRPVLAEGREAPVALLGYRLPPGELRAEGRVLTPDGREVGTGGLRVVGREGAGDGGPDRLRAVFLPPPLGPGDYLLRVTLTDETGGAAGTSDAPFHVQGAAESVARGGSR